MLKQNNCILYPRIVIKIFDWANTDELVQIFAELMMSAQTIFHNMKFNFEMKAITLLCLNNADQTSKWVTASVLMEVGLPNVLEVHLFKTVSFIL